MKTLITLIAAFAISFSSFANPIEKSLTETASVEAHGQKLKVLLNEAVGKVNISILDAKGKLVDRNHYNSKKALVIPYDLSQLPEGEYKVKIENKEETASFTVTSKRPVARRLMAYGKIVDDNTVNLLVVGLEKPGITVNIYDENNRKIKTDKITEKEGFSRNYKFENINAKKVNMEVTDVDGKSKWISFQ